MAEHRKSYVANLAVEQESFLHTLLDVIEQQAGAIFERDGTDAVPEFVIRIEHRVFVQIEEITECLAARHLERLGFNIVTREE
jgi:hypothetical protein